MTSDAIASVENSDARGGFVIGCEHASNHIPEHFNQLGLASDLYDSHIAWDPGALAVARYMARFLDAPLVVQNISRLVYDCNRAPTLPSAIPEKSESFLIPGNNGLSVAQRAERVTQYYEPFHNVFSTCLDQLQSRQPIIVMVHSFTPIYFDKLREVEIGVLHDADAAVANLLLPALQNGSYNVQRNAPYGPEDNVTHNLCEHGVKRGLHNVMLEIRNDLITTDSQQKNIAQWLADALLEVSVTLGK